MEPTEKPTEPTETSTPSVQSTENKETTNTTPVQTDIEPGSNTPAESETKTEETQAVTHETDATNEAEPQISPMAIPADAAVHTSSKKKKVILLAIIIVLILGGGGFGAYFMYFKKDPVNKTAQVQPQQQNTQQSADPALKTEETSSTILPDQVPTAPVCKFDATAISGTWLEKVETVKDLKAINYTPDDSSTLTYLKIGATATGQSIFYFEINLGLDMTNGTLLEETPGKYAVIAKNSPWFIGDDGKPRYELPANTRIDTANYFSDLCVSELTYKGQKLLDASGSGIGVYASYFASYSADNTSELEKYNVGTLYEYTYKSATDYKMASFVLLRKDGTWQQLKPIDTLAYRTDGKKQLDATWTDGSANDHHYSTMFRGCGQSYSIEVATKVTDKDLEQIGTVSNGMPIYFPKSLDSTLLALHYDEYKTMYGDNGYMGNEHPELKNLSLESYAKTRPFLIIKDQFDRYIVYVKDDYNGGGGCAKPVVYLYPEQETNVQVRVGADVTISEPQYENGWEVTAQPNGALTHKGKQYDSLFWEGYGEGFYPHTTRGVVVASKDAAETVKQHLTQLGLNEKESADFLEFWLPKLPANKPFTRLTWLGTREMENLAPLHVTPAPDTLIRVFLDAEGLDAPIDLPAQKLTAIPRRGFTVVEWGGLLDGKLQ